MCSNSSKPGREKPGFCSAENNLEFSFPLLGYLLFFKKVMINCNTYRNFEEKEHMTSPKTNKLLNEDESTAFLLYMFKYFSFNVLQCKTCLFHAVRYTTCLFMYGSCWFVGLGCMLWFFHGTVWYIIDGLKKKSISAFLVCSIFFFSFWSRARFLIAPLMSRLFLLVLKCIKSKNVFHFQMEWYIIFNAVHHKQLKLSENF